MKYTLMIINSLKINMMIYSWRRNFNRFYR